MIGPLVRELIRTPVPHRHLMPAKHPPGPHRLHPARTLVIFVGAPRGEIGSFCDLARGERRFGNGGHRREPTLSDPIEANRRQWAERLPVHLASGFYDVAAFKAGRSSLRSIELEEVGSVTDRDLLHLQCHFGLDTISWARLGARVTGVDFESGAIETARRLANELGVAARFVCSTIDDLPNALDAEFDVLFASYGVLMWLPDLERWAELVAHFLRPPRRVPSRSRWARRFPAHAEALLLPRWTTAVGTRYRLRRSFPCPRAPVVRMGASNRRRRERFGGRGAGLRVAARIPSRA